MSHSHSLTTDNDPVSHFTLQESIGEMIRVLGWERTLRTIDSLSENIGNLHRATFQAELVKKHIIEAAIVVFGLNKRDFYKEEKALCREARMVCYHLIYKHTGESHAGIAKLFGKKRNSATYFIGKCNGILSVARSHRDFMERYKAVEDSAVALITGLKQYRNSYIRTICSQTSVRSESRSA